MALRKYAGGFLRFARIHRKFAGLEGWRPAAGIQHLRQPLGSLDSSLRKIHAVDHAPLLQPKQVLREEMLEQQRHALSFGVLDIERAERGEENP